MRQGNVFMSSGDGIGKLNFLRLSEIEALRKAQIQPEEIENPQGIGSPTISDQNKTDEQKEYDIKNRAKSLWISQNNLDPSNPTSDSEAESIYNMANDQVIQDIVNRKGLFQQTSMDIQSTPLPIESDQVGSLSEQLADIFERNQSYLESMKAIIEQVKAG